jgi:hypothetical protein
MANMTPKNIAIVQGHPAPDQSDLCHALEETYCTGAEQAGHMVSTVTVATLEFPLLRTHEGWVKGNTPAGLLDAQRLLLGSECRGEAYGFVPGAQGVPVPSALELLGIGLLRVGVTRRRTA